MNWYMVKLIFRIVCGDGLHKAQFEEQLRLIEAEDAAAAFEKARKIGMSESRQVLNVGKQQVQWQFINLSELYRLNGFLDGAELYSRLNESENGEIFEELTNRRAEVLHQNIQHRLLDIF